MRAEPLVGEDRHRRFERIKAAANRYATTFPEASMEQPTHYAPVIFSVDLGLMYQSVLS